MTKLEREELDGDGVAATPSKAIDLLQRVDLHKTLTIKASVQTWRHDGTRFPGTARAWLLEMAPNNYEVIPFLLKQDGGYELSIPDLGQPIATSKPISSRKEAEIVFARWAQQTYLKNWRSAEARLLAKIINALDAADFCVGSDEHETHERSTNSDREIVHLIGRVQNLSERVAALELASNAEASRYQLPFSSTPNST